MIDSATIPLGTRSPAFRDRFWAHVQIARADHWVKNVFVLPGIIVVLSLDPGRLAAMNPLTVLAAFAAICLITSSNYVINEVKDASFDSMHPTKRNRPVPSGLVNIKIAYVEWIALMVVGLVLSWQVGVAFTVTMAVLWVMGCLYNLQPVRTKDLPYLDVLSEAVNNPLRMLAGWYMTGTSILPPSSLLASYWMVGCFFMATKRFAEYREIGDPSISAAYRRSFAYYTEQRLLVSILFYASAAMLMFGAFVVKYRLELILTSPLVATVIAVYFDMAFNKDSAAQRPEALYRDRNLMLTVFCCAAAMIALLFIDVPIVHTIFVDYPNSRMPLRP